MQRALLWAALALGLAGCATLPSGQRTPGDPFERVNRSIWAFDNGLDHKIVRPIATGYVRVLPSRLRTGVHNFMTNLVYSDTVVNDFLQGQFKDGGNDLARLLVNTVFGIGGIFDPASRLNLDRHDRDLGQTFGVWGVDMGPFLMLPFLGPSDVRDGLGRLGDNWMEPFPYLNVYAEYGLYLGYNLDERVQLLPEDRIIDSAYDSYAFVRDAYLQARRYKVHGSQTETPEQLFPELNEQGEGSDAATPPNSPTTPPSTPAAPAKPATGPAPSATPPR